MDLDTAEMDRLTAGLPTKSAKMRALANAGYSRSDIARFLNVKYQFVRNVLLREEGRRYVTGPSDAGQPAPKPEPGSNRVRLGENGQLALPDPIRSALGLKAGDVLFAHLEDGEVHLLTPTAAARRAQAIVRSFVPEGVSLVDELIEDRRREVARESGDE